MRKIYTDKQRNEILQQYWSGVPVAIISADTGIAKSTLYKWIKSISTKLQAANIFDHQINRYRTSNAMKESYFKCHAIDTEEIYSNRGRPKGIIQKFGIN